MKLLFEEHSEQNAARTAILMSGTGSNACALLEYCRTHACAWSPQLLLTDNPRCCAKEVAEKYALALETADIYEFYRQNGSDNIRLENENQRNLRSRWSGMLYEILQHYEIELVLFAGFVPLTNLTEKLPCLNVHPGDLTCLEADGSRTLAGLHYAPVEKALCRRFSGTRSSVILAQPYTGSGKNEMDTGPVLGISEQILFDLPEGSIEELIRIQNMRQGKPAEKTDRLRQTAAGHIEKMKRHGDHVIFPQAADDFARGRFALDDAGQLLFRQDCGSWAAICSVEYRKDGRKLLERSEK